MKKISKICAMLFMYTVMSSINGVQAYAYSPIPDNNTAVISPKADIIEWRNKIVNGKLYKRQYNCTTQKWIGDWILVA